MLCWEVALLLNEHDELLYYFYKNAATILKKKHLQPKNWFELMSRLRYECSYSNFSRAFTDCWLAFLSLPLDTQVYRQVLEVLHQRIIPFMYEPCQLMDFLVDAYDAGGLVSILALNGLFTLIVEHNLDYPHFYDKLYALLDKNVMHVRHVPAYLVAAFIKKMARLALFAPPAATLIVIPLIHNLLRQHPVCRKLIHSEVSTQEPCNDPYLFDEMDPAKSNAADSSLWEIEMLKKHYHPSVASLALVFQEPFAKQPYNLEDFLDHSYKTLFDAEFSSQKQRIQVPISNIEFSPFADSLWIY